MDLTLKWSAPGEDFADALAVRMEVFVAEQGFQNELEERDEHAYHLSAYAPNGEAVACGRLQADEKRPGCYVVGRLAVRPAWRAGGTGRKLMAEIERKGRELGARRFHLSAQVQARPFYEKLGYRAVGGEYLDEHCPHIGMEKEV